MNGTRVSHRLRPRRVRLGGALLAIGLLVTTTVRAQQVADTAMRRELLNEAQRAAEANDHGRALELAARAASIETTPSVRMFIAQQQLALGRYGDAYASATACVAEVERDAALRNRDAILATCRAAIDATAGRVGRIVVRVPQESNAGARITVDGRELNPAFVGVPYVVTAGRVTVRATAPGREAFEASVSVPSGASVPVDVTFNRASAGAAGGTPGSTVRGGRNLLGPAVLLAVGGAGAVALPMFLALRGGAIAQLDRYCGPPDASGVRHCDDVVDARSANGAQATYSVLVDVAIGVGAVGVGIGVAWLIGALSAPDRSERRRAAFVIAPQYGGVTAAWRFEL